MRALDSLAKAEKPIQQRMVNNLAKAGPKLGKRVAKRPETLRGLWHPFFSKFWLALAAFSTNLRRPLDVACLTDYCERAERAPSTKRYKSTGAGSVGR